MLTDGVTATDLPDLDIPAQLEKVKDRCAWTSSTWDFGTDQVHRGTGSEHPKRRRILAGHLLRALR
jgi:hypothetical protein